MGNYKQKTIDINLKEIRIMKLNNIKYVFLSLFAIMALVSCSNDNGSPDPIAVATCDDGIMNGDETSLDCGGSCKPCDAMSVDFSGTYAQEDHMGRPGINTVLGLNDNRKDAFNLTIPSNMAAAFQADFEEKLQALHGAFGASYENNILGLDVTTLTTVLAMDVLDVAPDAPTTYFNPGTDNDNDGRILVPDGDEVALTGRTPQDDVIDVSLILLFGGMEGDRFSGRDTDNDGQADLPRLTSDGVGLTADIATDFPYLGAPE
jgi:hypothetical protein